MRIPASSNRWEDEKSPQFYLTCNSINIYLETLHNAIPIIPKDELALPKRTVSCSSDLLSTIVVITASITNTELTTGALDVEERINQLLSSQAYRIDLSAQPPSKDQFRINCLLAFYEFHQYPGHSAWERIGQLSRSAYWVGLDCLEDLHTRHSAWTGMSEYEVEQWRLIWWCIYRLDSYANFAVGMPYSIDEAAINTALIRWVDLPEAQCASSSEPKSCLPYDPGALSELLPSISQSPQASALFNIHLVTTTAVRQVGRSLRLHTLRPLEAQDFLSTAERHISLLRLAMPTDYFNPRRNVFGLESVADHQTRLESVLHLTMARLAISIVRCNQYPEGEDWIMCWQQVLEACQDIGSVSEQWDSSFALKIDPAISLIVFTALIFLNVHKNSSHTPVLRLRSSIEHYESVLLTQLEQLAKSWTVPRLLVCK